MADLTATLVPLNDKLYTHFTNFTAAYWIGPKQFFYPKFGPPVVEKFQQFKARDDDVCVVTFPKTGTTWMQEIVYMLSINLDFEKAKRNIRETVFPYADLNAWEEPVPLDDFYEIISNMPSPRLIKFHLNYSFLPPDVKKRCKIVYVCRNVKDTIVSYYHFCCAVSSTKFQGSIEDFAELFMENKIPYAPYISHVKEFWEKRNEKNIFFATYEDMQKDQEKVIKDVAAFLNVSVSNEGIKAIADHCKFDNIKQNPAVNKSDWGDLWHQKDFKFMRKGIVGSWHTEMNQQLIDKIDKWTHDQTIDTPDLRKILLN